MYPHCLFLYGVFVKGIMTDIRRNLKFLIRTIVKLILFVGTFELLRNLFYCCASHVSLITVLVREQNPTYKLIDPSNSSDTVHVDDVFEQLIDLQNFSFKINSKPCSSPAGLLMVIVIISHPAHSENRKVIRHTWGQTSDAVKRVFLVGDPENETVTEKIIEESEAFNDIVQGNFVDVYYNLTYKHVMGLKWVTHNCRNARYILKTDDDIMVNSNFLTHFLAREISPWGARDLMMCKPHFHTQVERSYRSKFRISQSEHPGRYYPDYCAGWAIIYSQDVVRRLLKASESEPYFWIEDVHVTGTLAKNIGVKLTPLSNLILTADDLEAGLTGWWHKSLKFYKPFLIGPYDIKPTEIWTIWNATQSDFLGW